MTNPLHDSEEVRRNAAWFQAGVNASGSYCAVATVIVSVVAAVVAEILKFEPYAAAVSTGLAILSINVGGFTLLSYRSRDVARTESVSVDRF
ncbi:hypothetical protein [Tepidimonas fonticaldi]|uniref:hypothetical protein n=1 Tax=Tepidimonas fonticaldi TaxID=1101373 RepID=UPI0012E74A09|nr:hypothetical protein [Tepidimonas fonticaldi]